MVTNLTGLVIGVLLVVGMFLMYQWLKNPQKYPHEDAIEKALWPYIYQAIMLAYKSSERHLNEFGERLSGMDKKALPARIQVGQYLMDVSFIKAMIPPEMFAKIVQRTFDDFLIWYTSVWEKYGDELNEYL